MNHDTSDFRCAYEPVAFRPKWTARALTQCDGAPLCGLSGSPLPPAQAWRESLSQLAENPESLPDCEFLKHSKTAQVLRARLTVGDAAIDVVCKGTRDSGILATCASRILGSRARRNHARALKLLGAGVATAMPLALLEEKVKPRRAWLIAETIPDAVDLDQVALMLLSGLDRSRRRAVKDALIDAVVDVFIRLQRSGLFHRDLKASNFLITNWAGASAAPRIWIVDLDGLHRHLPMIGKTRTRATRGLTRLAASLAGYASVTRTDYLRFFAAYVARTTGNPTAWKTAFRTIGQSATRYGAASQRRKREKLDGFEGAA